MFRAIVIKLALSVTFCLDTMPAQTFRGAIQGTVTDSTGSTVPGAKVTVVSDDTNFTREVLTNDSGNYLFTELPLGSYNVSAEKSGFERQIATGVRVAVDTSPRVDLAL